MPAAAPRRAAADLTRRAALEKALAPEPDGPGVLVKLRCPDGSTATRKFATDAPAGALLDWCDVRGVDLEAFVVRKAAGDRVVRDDRTSLLGDVLGARALLVRARARTGLFYTTTSPRDGLPKRVACSS